MADNPFRGLPSVNNVLASPVLQALGQTHAHDQVVAAVRLELDELRTSLAKGTPVDGQGGVDAVAGRVVERLHHELAPKLRSVINATGIVLHTNLGRAPIA